jgi:hypothetical protein
MLYNMGLAGHRERKADQKVLKMWLVVWSGIPLGRNILATASMHRAALPANSDSGTGINPICGGDPAFCRSDHHRPTVRHIPLGH